MLILRHYIILHFLYFLISEWAELSLGWFMFSKHHYKIWLKVIRWLDVEMETQTQGWFNKLFIFIFIFFRVITKLNQRSFEWVNGEGQTSGSSIHFLQMYKVFVRMRTSRGEESLYPTYWIASTNIFHGY